MIRLNDFMMKRTFMRLSFISLFMLSASALSAQLPLLSTADAIALVKKTVEQEKLVDRTECVDYFYSGKASAHIDIIKVVEKHGGTCGGDPGVAPRLFSVYVDLQNHQMASDKDDVADGTLSLLPPPQ